MTKYPFNFPIITLDKTTFDYCQNVDVLTKTTNYVLKGGYFNNLLLIDCTGKSWIIKEATKLNSIGLFWGYNVFLEQNIRVKFKYKENKKIYNLLDVKKLILDKIYRDRYFGNQGEFDEIVSTVNQSESILNLFELLKQDLVKGK